MNAPAFGQVQPNQSLPKPKEAKMENQTEKMKEYILLVHLPRGYGPEQAEAVREQWNALLDQWKSEGKFVTSFVYPNDGYLVSGGAKTISEDGVVSNGFRLVSNMIVRAGSYEAALELAKACPVLAQEGRIEVREIQPRPLIP